MEGAIATRSGTFKHECRDLMLSGPFAFQVL